MHQELMDKRTVFLKRILILCLFLLCFFVFSLTLSYRFYGYEYTTLDYFRNLFYCRSLSGRTPAGILDIFSYLPMEWVNLVIVSPQNLITRDFIALQTLPLTSALVCVVFFALCLELYGSVQTAVGSTLILAFTTMIWPYSKMGMEIQHTLWPLAALCMIVRWHKNQKPLDLVLAGAFMLYMLIISLREKDRGAQRFSNFFRFLVPIVILFALFLVQNRIRHGDWFLGDRYNVGYEAKRVPVWQPLAGFLFSSGKSLFVYNPLLIVSLFFLPKFFRRFPRLKLLFILVFGLGLVFHSLLWIWTDETWGPRKLLFLVPLGILPLGIMKEEFGSLSLFKRTLILFTGILAVFVQILGVSFSYETEPVLLKSCDLSSMENIRYNPHLSHTTINYALLESTIDRYLTAAPHYYVYRPTYFATVLPSIPPKPAVLALDKFSYFDFWFLDHRAPRKGFLRLSPNTRFYFSLVLLIIPCLFFILYLLVGKLAKSGSAWTKTASGWMLFLFVPLGIVLCLRYNHAYSKNYKFFLAGIPDFYDFAIGDDSKDEAILGPGWRESEWMKDVNKPGFEVPFRWTNSWKSWLYFPAKPYQPYHLTLQTIFVYPTRISLWVNQHCVGYASGNGGERKNLAFSVPKDAIGLSLISEVMILHQNLHVPCEENPKSQDRSTLGIMVYGVRWERLNQGK